MDIFDVLWVGLGIAVIVGFVFYVLALYWERLLKQHSQAIRTLSERVEILEEMEDPRFRRKVGDSAPSPLERVYIFSFRLAERFWPETVGASPEQLRYIRENGNFLSSVKIQRWRSHIAVTLTELLPQSQSARWQTRVVDIYPTKNSASSTVLWELHLEPALNSHWSELPPTLELRYENESLVLRARHCEPGVRVEGNVLTPTAEKMIFRVSLDPDALGEYRVSEDAGERPAGEDDGADSRLAFYRFQDERMGVDWQLCVRDLDRKAVWERWNIVEPWQTRRVS
ncbi:MAG TPA: hypothetical protein VGR81_10935 [Candidatus Acidoferrales bacterium]|nr:hypothetical protein [Candidatus Acidoferrales bacterium]